MIDDSDNEKGFFPDLSEEEVAAMPAPPPSFGEQLAEDILRQVETPPRSLDRTQADGEMLRAGEWEAVGPVLREGEGQGYHYLEIDPDGFLLYTRSDYEAFLWPDDGYEYAIVRRKKDGA